MLSLSKCKVFSVAEAYRPDPPSPTSVYFVFGSPPTWPAKRKERWMPHRGTRDGFKFTMNESFLEDRYDVELQGKVRSLCLNVSGPCLGGMFLTEDSSSHTSIRHYLCKYKGGGKYPYSRSRFSTSKRGLW